MRETQLSSCNREARRTHPWQATQLSRQAAACETCECRATHPADTRLIREHTQVMRTLRRCLKILQLMCICVAHTRIPLSTRSTSHRKVDKAGYTPLHSGIRMDRDHHAPKEESPHGGPAAWRRKGCPLILGKGGNPYHVSTRPQLPCFALCHAKNAIRLISCPREVPSAVGPTCSQTFPILFSIPRDLICAQSTWQGRQ
ncbi:hypothetical protein GGR54DRAFT_123993 [Hypoxylon sp. NC1633]|nr:hypothetical protein GGR54DRAFT_123993 [Hypoxylon sp. NC1633]